MKNKMISIELGKDYETEDGNIIHIWGFKKIKNKHLYLGYVIDHKIYEEMYWTKRGKKIDNVTKETKERDPLNIVKENNIKISQ